MSTPDTSVDYQRLFRALPDNFLLIAPNADATILDNTDSHVAVSLKPREAVVGRPFFEAYPAVDQNQGDIIAASHQHVREHLEPHTMPVIRYDLAQPGGGYEEMYWQATHFPVLDEQGHLQYILQRTQNVTEQLRAAQVAEAAKRALTEAQERTHFILENLPVLIWTATPDGERDFFNSRWLAFTGRPLADEVGMGWTAGVHPDDRERVLATWQKARESGGLYQVEYRLRRHDGQYRWMLVRASPRRDAAGTLTMWVGGALEIQEQREMVQELLEANEQHALLSEQATALYRDAESQRETFHSLFQQAPAMICILRGPQHAYEFVNPAYQQIFPHRQLVGHTVAEILPEVQSQGIIQLLDHVYLTGETYHGQELRLELERDGSRELREGYFNFIYQQFREKGQPAGIMVFAFEVTELVQARRALEQLRDGAGPQAEA